MAEDTKRKSDHRIASSCSLDFLDCWTIPKSGDKMAFENRLKAAENTPLLSTGPIQPSSHPTSGLKSIFAGHNGLRAGWRLLIFLALLGVPAAVLVAVARASGGSQQAKITPLLLVVNDAVVLLALCVVTWIMAKIEHRKLSEYGLPLRHAFRKDFWVGSLLGFLAISGTLLTMFLLHGFRVTGLALHGTAIVSSLAAWSIAFLLAGLFEEFAFRGYVQYTLASGMGFWPAAFLISGLFGLAHFIADPNENVVGSAAVVLFGLLLCLFLRRTGNLWCAVGFHVAWDWGQMFYGVPDSGIVPYHNLFNSVLSGPRWLTGGTVGPEASVLTPIALLVVALVFSRYYRENRYQITKPVSSPVTSRVTSSLLLGRFSYPRSYFLPK
jgi:membrane protease YdiL (CAAX protease family)